MRLLRGNWDVADEGELFHGDWFQVIDPSDLPAMTHAVRYWDLAGTAPSDVAADPDYTVGLKLERDAGGIFYITDIARARRAPGGVEQLVAETASLDGPDVRIVIEQEPGASGVALIDNYFVAADVGCSRWRKTSAPRSSRSAWKAMKAFQRS